MDIIVPKDKSEFTVTSVRPLSFKGSRNTVIDFELPLRDSLEEKDPSSLGARADGCVHKRISYSKVIARISRIVRRLRYGFHHSAPCHNFDYSKITNIR